MSNTRSLSALSNEALATIAATEESPIAEAILVERNRGLILKTARRYGRRLEVDDAFGVAAHGFVVAVRKFDAARGLRLSTLAVLWMRHTLGRYQALHCGAAVGNERVEKDARDVALALKTLGADTDDSSIAKALSITPFRVRAAKSWLTLQNPLSLDAPATAGEGSTRHELIGNGSAESAFFSGVLPEWLDVLTPREVRIAVAYALEDKTLEEIGQELRVSRERVRQILHRAKEKVSQRREVAK